MRAPPADYKSARPKAECNEGTRQFNWYGDGVEDNGLASWHRGLAVL